MNPALAPYRSRAVVPPPGPALKAGDRGPDVSSYQPNVDWGAVAGAGYRFAFVKATESTDYLNPYFGRDWQQTADNGLVRGAYHFARPDSNTPQAEVEWFVGHLLPWPVSRADLFVLDLEVGSGDLGSWAVTFASLFHDRTKIAPYLYTGGPFMSAHGLDNPGCAQAFENKLWVAAYQANPPPVPSGWASLSFWQYTDGEAVPGVQGACDVSVYRP